MALFAGILRTDDATPITEIQPDVIDDVMAKVLARFQRERNEAQNLLVAGQVTKASELVKLSGYDEGQEIGPDGRPLETYTGGSYTVGYGMRRFGWALGYNEETFANLTVGDIDLQVDAKLAGNARLHRRRIMRAVFRNTSYTFTDDIEQSGSVTVYPLANGDSTDFDGEGTTANNYAVSGYAASAISSTNNPLVTIKSKLAALADGEVRAVAFINSAQRGNIISGLNASFQEASVEGISPAAADARAIALGVNVPGTFIGVDAASGVWVYEWDIVPAGYIFGMNPDLPGPVVRRVPSIASLQDFRVRAEEQHFPFYKRTWIERFDYAVRNRLNGVVVQLKASGSYDIPTI